MDGLLVTIAVVVVLLGLGIAALEWGTESRPGFTEDHNR
jgi:hypothetical protein